jgi:hypothetical protein
MRFHSVSTVNTRDVLLDALKIVVFDVDAAGAIDSDDMLGSVEVTLEELCRNLRRGTARLRLATPPPKKGTIAAAGTPLVLVSFRTRWLHDAGSVIDGR